LIIKPNVSVPTKDVFQDPELTRNSPPITIHGFLASGGGNDCLKVVRRRYPEVARAMEWLLPFGEPRLTGTGSCVFMVCEEARARELLRALPAEWSGYSARGLNDSPLMSRLESCRE
jgi:4-diphosphocytidyl-2-C-methyl-D-erythritol kinase